MNYLRKFKIHKAIPTLTDQEIEIYSFLSERLGNLTVFKPYIYSSIYYMDFNGKCMIEQRNNTIIINKFLLWSIIKDNYKLEYTPIWKFIDAYLKMNTNIKYDIVLLNAPKNDTSEFEECELYYKYRNLKFYNSYSIPIYGSMIYCKLEDDLYLLVRKNSPDNSNYPHFTKCEDLNDIKEFIPSIDHFIIVEKLINIIKNDIKNFDNYFDYLNNKRLYIKPFITEDEYENILQENIINLPNTLRKIIVYKRIDINYLYDEDFKLAKNYFTEKISI